MGVPEFTAEIAVMMGIGSAMQGCGVSGRVEGC